MATSGHQAYLIAAATHPDAPDEALFYIVDGEERLYARADYRQYSVSDGFAQAPTAVAARKGVPVGLLTYLAQSDDHEVAAAAISNRELSAGILAVLAADEDTWRRRLVAASSRCPARSLEELATDPDERVREAVAGNPKASEAARALAGLTL